MYRLLNRRRFLAITASAIAAPGGLRAGTAAWRGTALGAAASITLGGTGGAEAGQTFAAVTAELERLEQVFSLYRPESALSRLNRDGRLVAPPADLVEILALCDSLHAATGGAFDPTVQPLWLALARHRSARDNPSLEATADLVGWSGVEFERAGVALSRSGMALTLNGVAQGYIADRVAGLLRRRGLTDVLVDMGEIAALGGRPDGSPWRAAVARPDGRILRQVTLSERALATSAPRGTLLDPAGRIGHILDPRDGQPGGRWQLVSVSAPRAALADGLSTAFCLMPRGAIAAALRRYPEATLETLV